MIGGYTGIGCAHSFYNRTTQQWYSAHNWAVSRVQTTNYLSSPPTTTTSGSPVYSQCFTVTIPASYTTGNNEGDFAILDFAGCGLYPGYSYGWMWPAYSTSISAYNGTVHGLIAYDQNDAPPQPHGLSNWYSTPTLIDRGARPAGTMWIDNFNHWRFMYTMSVTGGSSGGGVAGYLFGTSGALYWLGNNAWSDVATGANGGRVLTPGSWGFIQAYSQEY